MSKDAENGWVITSACGEQYRTWRSGSPAWTSNPHLAVRYARRCDAERVHEEDEDAWRVVPFPLSDERYDEIKRLREALDWAVADIEGRTRYTADFQRENCLVLAHKALSA